MSMCMSVHRIHFPKEKHGDAELQRGKVSKDVRRPRRCPSPHAVDPTEGIGLVRSDLGCSAPRPLIPCVLGIPTHKD